MTTLAIATPVKGHLVTDGYHHSVVKAMLHPQVRMQRVFNSNDDLVRSRSRALRWFLHETDCDRLLFWDSDHPVEPTVIADMMAMPFPVVACRYLTKEAEPKLIPPIPDMSGVDEHRTVPADYAPLGLFMVSRKVAELVTEHYRKDLEFVDIVEGKAIPTVAVFALMLEIATELDGKHGAPVGKRVLFSEDYSFCRRLRACGIPIRVRVEPIPHQGMWTYK